MATDELTRLASAVKGQAAVDGVYETAVPALRLSRFSAPSDLAALVYEPCLCMVAQGAKEVLLADETYRLDPAQSLPVSVDLPITARVVEASPTWVDPLAQLAPSHRRAGRWSSGSSRAA